VNIMDILGWIFTFGLLVLIAAKLAELRSWARWLFFYFAILGLIFSALSFAASPESYGSASTLFYAFALLQTVIQLAALFLVFTPDSRNWFAS